MDIFRVNPSLDSENLREKLVHDEKGLLFYFRSHSIRLQKLFAGTQNLDSQIRVFLHGNPHIDNISATANQTALVDFDRSRIGPYSWDLIRFLSSLSLMRANRATPFLKKEIIDAFFEGYSSRIKKPELGWDNINFLMDRPTKKWQKSTEAYLHSSKKWAQYFKKYCPSPAHKKAQRLLNDYCNQRSDKDLLTNYKLDKIATASGTFGKRRYLLWFAPKNSDDDSVLFEIKQTYRDKDNRYFFNPFKHHGMRMIYAENLYAPRFEKRTGFASYKGEEYWCRQINPSKRKIKEFLDTDELTEVAFSVGSQLGTAHARSIYFSTPMELLNDVEEQKKDFIETSKKMNDLVIKHHKIYKKEYAALKEKGDRRIAI